MCNSGTAVHTYGVRVHDTPSLVRHSDPHMNRAQMNRCPACRLSLLGMLRGASSLVGERRQSCPRRRVVPNAPPASLPPLSSPPPPWCLLRGIAEASALVPRNHRSLVVCDDALWEQGIRFLATRPLGAANGCFGKWLVKERLFLYSVCEVRLIAVGIESGGWE
jgi:hypothetical protein